MVIKEYGRTELAMMYCPYITPAAAWRRLRKWIGRNPMLSGRLRASGYHEKQRVFTPEQTRLVIEHIGEPYSSSSSS